jgi:hypothetical protein
MITRIMIIVNIILNLPIYERQVCALVISYLKTFDFLR